MSDLKIKRALIAVYDKTGIVEFARALVDEFAIEIISTGGTAKVLKDAGVPVTMVEQVTGFPEMLDGRVKTLHPKIHAAILADRDKPDHMRQLAEHGIEPIDMVVVNLYPFEQTIAKPDCKFEDAIEMIDIGGPCLLRAAAKNHKHVSVVHNPRDYDVVLDGLRRGGQPSDWSKRGSARDAFMQTCWYDAQISSWLSHMPWDRSSYRFLRLFDFGALRYGENPHQAASRAGIWADASSMEPDLVLAEFLGEDDECVSFNNYVDGDSALSLVKELTRAALTRVGPASCRSSDVGPASCRSS
ncbi:MAG: bifunctional phosphoribosylaminoimidazolecarboxamide formyltransferase/IMP cyclohydrolase, partial [Planctomycetes bacterium]|nr:bifunctional phosphoribosylaminoimidazolecarboxamide formyltransferase/IMP cyclohydrolase [Planctomycetota bacterium]